MILMVSIAADLEKYQASIKYIKANEKIYNEENPPKELFVIFE